MRENTSLWKLTTKGENGMLRKKENIEKRFIDWKIYMKRRGRLLLCQAVPWARGLQILPVLTLPFHFDHN